MLEGLVAWVLNNYLGKYVENLNTDQLSIALLSGEVELENLPLKKDALRHIGLPIEVRAGFIGKVKLQIPVRQIRSAPWVIVIEQLYVVASPLPLQEWDAAAEEAATNDIKLSALDVLEAKWRIETDAKENTSTYYASTYSSWLTYGTGFITDIVENLQLKIRDVHIRYEDSVCIPDKAVAFGITIESLSAQSCDSNWSPGFSHWVSSEASYKLLELHKLSVYWDLLMPSQLLSNLSLGDLAVAMAPNSTTVHNYILAPVSSHAHVKRNCSELPLRDSKHPRIVCDLQLDEVPLCLIDWQYDQIVKCIQGLDDITRLRRYRRWRPSCSVKDDARAWWLYAITCYSYPKQPSFCKPRPTWESCLIRAKQNVKYVGLYVQILSTPTIALSSDEKTLKDEVEWSREYEDLKVLREVAMRKVPITHNPNDPSYSKGRSTLLRWFPQWWGWYSSAPTATTNAEFDNNQLETKLLEALEDNLENNTLLKRDVVFGKFNFSLKSGTINLCTTSDNITKDTIPMIELQFENLKLNIESRPRSSSHGIELILGALYLRDKLTAGSLFPVLIGPPGPERIGLRTRTRSSLTKANKLVEQPDNPFFQLNYDFKPLQSNCEYKLAIKSQSLDVVYQPNAVRWLVEFLYRPHQRTITHTKIEQMKNRTKMELMKNWENILDGRAEERKSWEVSLDISAPQIIFVEQFCDPNSAIAVVDFGHLQLSNTAPESQSQQTTQLVTKESEDDEMFMTPCSTPPGSETSETDTLPLNFTTHKTTDTLSELAIHHKLYDRYCVELNDLQILVGRVKDNWRYAHTKGTSTLHVLDRFNISLNIERRIVHTSDPLYPSLTLSANLPRLVAHINEHKISAARKLSQIISATSLPSPFNSPESTMADLSKLNTEEDSISLDTSIEMSRLFMIQFTIDHMALEVQSRGRSIAELQVSGVRTAFTKRPYDITVSLTVHSLLLVDALQTFGPDFELLVASHKHVGMDSLSGSLRDSEPTSPTSPGSPDPNANRVNATSPIALTQALSSLASSPPPPSATTPWNSGHQFKAPTILDAEALISIEVVIVGGTDPMHIATIQFNNLDIIANQETIVELVGFVRRVFPQLKSTKQPLQINRPNASLTNLDSVDSPLATPNICRTELTFDFHRLNVLLLRGVVKDGCVYGKKIGTATLSEAKIQATVDNSLVVEGSLGGLQVVDLTPEGHVHQRIISVGRDPLTNTHPLYAMSNVMYFENERKAFSFNITRLLQGRESDKAEIHIRMASVWYTHSPHFLSELQSCATEFKQYLTNLARSISSAATDMALGLVHARAEALAQTLYMNSRLSSSLYGSALSLTDLNSPKRRRRSSSRDVDVIDTYSGYSSVRDTTCHTPYSPADNDNFVIDIQLDIILDSPVLVIPRASNSSEVFVAHLGKISMKNSQKNQSPMHQQTLAEEWENSTPRIERYDIEVRDMNLFSLDTSSRRVPGPLMNKVENLYCCKTLAKPILHDTILQLYIEREIPSNNLRSNSRQESLSNILLDDEITDSIQSPELTISEQLQIFGNVVTALKLSLTRAQFEQVLDTWQWLTSSHSEDSQFSSSRISSRPSTLSNISEEGIGTLSMDPHVRAKLFPAVPAAKTKPTPNGDLKVKISFELPIFTIELKGESAHGEQGLVDLSFREFTLNYEKCHRYETNVQVSLRSILMEDLLKPEDSKQRAMVVSSSGPDIPPGGGVSRSCPDLTGNFQSYMQYHGSLPDHLALGRHTVAEATEMYNGQKTEYPSTPPPSPSIKQRPERNLVIISSLLVDPSAPNFKTHYNSVQRCTSVDFNCLDLVVSVESWVVVIDFFSASPTDNSKRSAKNYNNLKSDIEQKQPTENTETTISVRSLTVVLAKSEYDIARANLSNVDLCIKTKGLQKEVEGLFGSMSLLDLTLQGQLYRERFLTSGKQALKFKYIRYPPKEKPEYDAQLKIDMSSVFYVHTKRFVAEIQSFFNHFTQLQAVMAGIRAATSGQKMSDDPRRLSLILSASAPIILVPVSSKSSQLLVADLGNLILTNSFKLAGDPETISVLTDASSDKHCLLDVMSIVLTNVDLYAGLRIDDCSSPVGSRKTAHDVFRLGSCVISKQGPSLLTEKCQLKLQVERNLDNLNCQNVPDLSIHGELSTLDGSIDLFQYKLIKGLLTYNLGENTEHILPSIPLVSTDPLTTRNVWTLSSMRFDLLNVTVRLELCHKKSSLACINFIKSRLTIETCSNFTQDIDLVSQEILIMDTRFEDAPANKRSNVFMNILQPINCSQDSELVQAEIHSRKRQDRTKFTILLNNMRLMAILDWWEAARDFIFAEDTYANVSNQTVQNVASNNKSLPFELKLNITDSEVVIVEDTSQWDTNAVILKSTTVISYRPNIIEKPLSCNLNNCEMYSCILGMEDETALSIIDPVTLNMDINSENVLEIQLQHLSIRLSYHDFRMFLQILNSLPKQTLGAKSPPPTQPANLKSQISKLTALGFAESDCIKALENCEHKLDDAALWLTQNAIPENTYSFVHQIPEQKESRLQISAVEVKAECISICIIDDCADADVPLLELTLSLLYLKKCIENTVPETVVQSQTELQEGVLECVLASDYYNRALSGWEPIIEPWKCTINWDHSLSADLLRNRFQASVVSNDLLNVNITSTFVDLYQQVHDNWMQDFYNDNGKDYSVKISGSPNGYRRRSPFVPFVIKNDTGSPLYFITLITDMESSYDSDRLLEQDDNWVIVPPGAMVPFSFKTRDKLRHQDSHKLKIHQLGVKVEGWRPVTPVTVDKVGVYFRHTIADMQFTGTQYGLPQTRIVFDVALQGSAKKLVTVRSALLIVNKLPQTIEIKLEGQVSPDAVLVAMWPASKTLIIPSNETLAVPLLHTHSQICVRPSDSQHIYTYCSPYLSWNVSSRNGDPTNYELRACHTPRGHVYRFCAEIKRENYPPDRTSATGFHLHPAHTITILPPLLLVNLLPTDLMYTSDGRCRGRIIPGAEAAITDVDTEKAVELGLNLENFPSSSPLIIASGTTSSFKCRLRLQDNSGRRLFLQAVVTPFLDARLKLIISSPFWIINRTGLPLVFRQEGVNSETAGQFEEHEVARMVAPLLFSFSDPDASPTVVARVGNAVIPYGVPQWCQNFHLHRGIQVRRLRVSLRDNKPDVVFMIGIEVRTGRGQYRDTNIVTISPRYQLHNKSSYELMFAQSCFASNVTDPGAQVTYLRAVPECFMPFHWPRLDKDQLLCVKIQDIPECCWSGGLKIDTNYSMHVNVRDIHGRMYFLRLEVVLQGATFFIVFTDADRMPPPIRVDNFSEVSVNFSQACCKENRSTARAHSSVPYAWDEPTKASTLCIIAPGGISATYDMNILGPATGLTYENFIYIAFTGTFKSNDPLDPLDVESQQLVLDVVDGYHIVLARKQPGERSQLWRMTSQGQLQHEGSSPPSLPNQKSASDRIMVLDIEGPAPQPSSYTRLMLKRPDPRRQSTQTWRFTEEGRLCCAHKNMCVQAQDGFFGLRQGSNKSNVSQWQQWNSAVLGLPQAICHRLTESGLPLEQAVSRQRLRPGSGFLSVDISTDGPTRVLSIHDINEKKKYAMPDAREWSSISEKQRPHLVSKIGEDDEGETGNCTREMQLNVRLAGLGISLIARRPPEELIYMQLNTIIAEMIITKTNKSFCISVQDIQCDNQLMETPSTVLLYLTRSRSTDEALMKLPAIHVTAEIQPTLNENAIIFKHFIITVKPVAIHLEERLLLKLFHFIGTGVNKEEQYNVDESDFETQRMLTEVSATHAKRYYFGIIKLVPSQIRLSMKTASKLPADLQSIKRKLGLTLIKFEDASVDLEPFVREHLFENNQFLMHSIWKHFKDELMWQAGMILGSVDFLGNPLGFVNDVSEGVSGLIYEGSVGALVKNVTHGISNSAAKVTESLSDGLGRVTMDDEHEEMRQRIRQVESGKSGDHLVAGIKGLGFGILGGATGIFKQVYEGAATEGIQGVFSGIGKGLVGAVTKPVVGVLDLASETARAVRDSSRSRIIPERSRPPRCVLGLNGILPPYNRNQSLGQQFLYQVNSRNYSEQLIAYESLRSGFEDLRIIASSHWVRIVTCANSSNTLATVIEAHLSDLQHCYPVTKRENGETRYYIEMTIRVQNLSMGSYPYQEPTKKPKVRCDSAELARWVSQQLNYAKRMYNEHLHTLNSDNIISSED